ncbi:MAG: tyrosine-type recombinase/integrase [Actinomycetota bacterium]
MSDRTGIREHHGKYQVRFYDPDDGKRKSKTFARLTDARAFKRGIEADKDRGEYFDPTRGQESLASYARSWLSTKENVRERTRINVAGRVRNHIEPAFGDKRIGSIRPADVRTWIAEMRAQGLAPATIRAAYRTFAQIMRTAEIDGVIRRSPCIGIELPAETSTEEMHFLSPTQVAALAQAMAPRYHAAIYTAAYAGLRAGELWALRIGHVDLRKRVLSVTESLSEVRGKLVAGPTKTRNRRTVSLPRFVADIIAEHLVTYPSDGHVFSAPEGGPVRHHNMMVRHFRPTVRRLAEDPALAFPGDLRFHDLRHSCAAILIGQGWSPKAIQDRLGHASIRTTLDRYGHLFEGHDAELLERLETFANGDEMGTRQGSPVL